VRQGEGLGARGKQEVLGHDHHHIRCNCTEYDGIFTVVNGKDTGYGDISHRTEGGMPEEHWQKRVKGILKAELKRRHVGYKELAEKLHAVGIEETDRNIANKIARGGFSAVFFVQCLQAIGCHTVHLEET
jgi:hypothetical protein